MEKISIGELLKKRRAELALTQREIANRVGVTEATVSRWESGDIDNMRRDKIAGLADALKVSPLLIMGIEDTKNFYNPANKEEYYLLNVYRGLDSDDKNLFLSILRRLRGASEPKINVNKVDTNYGVVSGEMKGKVNMGSHCE